MMTTEYFEFADDLFLEVQPRKEGIIKRFFRTLGNVIWTVISLPLSLVIGLVGLVVSPILFLGGFIFGLVRSIRE